MCLHLLTWAVSPCVWLSYFPSCDTVYGKRVKLQELQPIKNILNVNCQIIIRLNVLLQKTIITVFQNGSLEKWFEKVFDTEYQFAVVVTST